MSWQDYGFSVAIALVLGIVIGVLTSQSASIMAGQLPLTSLSLLIAIAATAYAAFLAGLFSVKVAVAPFGAITNAAVLIAAALLIVAGLSDQLEWRPSAVALLLATGAVFATTRAVDMLWRGEAFELQSLWGGLGGGLGGWRLSPVAGVAIVALAMVGATVAVTLTEKPNGTNRDPKSPGSEQSSGSAPHDATSGSATKPSGK